MQPLISVIVPAYNIEKYIERSINSICNQTYQNLEIIVVDDGSLDRTGEVIDRMAQKDSRIIPIHQKNAGVSSARMAGIKKSTGVYIGFVDGDDYIEPEMYEYLLNNAIKYHAEISHCGYKMIFPDGHEDLYYGTAKFLIQNHEEGLKDLLKGEFIEPGLVNKLFHKSLFNKFENSYLWDSSIRINEDLLMNYILFSRAKKTVYEDITYYHYILRSGSAATAKKQIHQITDPLEVMKRIMEDTKDNEELYVIAYERYLRLLINAALQSAWKEEAKKANVKLKQQFGRIITKRNISIKMKLMIFGVTYMNPIYRIIRIMYELVTGVSKKYEVD